ncbi:uncharacterized protein PGTG_20898 [Puccinia graminis f. sp. tritici CRL 75-36-700-3]|uniref:Glycogen [starch] synthase n=1 Tax=Puccinia graminis f. sp. tritici (strain CRL 75-36-700-3 / race SCCL) TaxID=418459 RepID=H6QPU6_PUCGT|nr:uncharacterized protein PGTG_20898 [Puccinia graminis f. sp. tritici CRL 75-36-700-3]EHS64284.1 hypothetical protein PGTG_20898 [Puccinia graminis f. sp. tritici CRL 75-36-700-3]
MTARYTGEIGTEVPDPSTLLSSKDKILLKRRVFALKRNSLPPVVTHNMADDSADPILNQIRRVQLFNGSHDCVKVIFHPDFLNSNNPILGLDYEEFYSLFAFLYSLSVSQTSSNPLVELRTHDTLRSSPSSMPRKALEKYNIIPPGRRGCTTSPARRESSWSTRLYNLAGQEGVLLFGEAVQPRRPGGNPPGRRG